MNTRQELIKRIDELAGGNEEVINTLKGFLDGVETDARSISNLLSGVDIENLGNIPDACYMAEEMARRLLW